MRKYILNGNRLNKRSPHFEPKRVEAFLRKNQFVLFIDAICQAADNSHSHAS